MGLVESFSSNFPCRMCKMEKKRIERKLFEDVSALRTKEGYLWDLEQKNVSLTGVKERCVWLGIDNFCMFQQMGYDVMHDLHEGCSKYIMSS